LDIHALIYGTFRSVMIFLHNPLGKWCTRAIALLLHLLAAAAPSLHFSRKRKVENAARKLMVPQKVDAMQQLHHSVREAHPVTEER
jgi:hypothetical protein